MQVAVNHSGSSTKQVVALWWVDQLLCAHAVRCTVCRDMTPGKPAFSAQTAALLLSSQKVRPPGAGSVIDTARANLPYNGSMVNAVVHPGQHQALLLITDRF